MAAVLEYMTAELCEMSGNAAARRLERGPAVILPEDVEAALRADAELLGTLRNVETEVDVDEIPADLDSYVELMDGVYKDTDVRDKLEQHMAYGVVLDEEWKGAELYVTSEHATPPRGAIAKMNQLIFDGAGADVIEAECFPHIQADVDTLAEQYIREQTTQFASDLHPSEIVVSARVRSCLFPPRFALSHHPDEDVAIDILHAIQRCNMASLLPPPDVVPGAWTCVDEAVALGKVRLARAMLEVSPDLRQMCRYRPATFSALVVPELEAHMATATSPLVASFLGPLSVPEVAFERKVTWTSDDIERELDAEVAVAFLRHVKRISAALSAEHPSPADLAIQYADSAPELLKRFVGECVTVFPIRASTHEMNRQWLLCWGIPRGDHILWCLGTLARFSFGVLFGGWLELRDDNLEATLPSEALLIHAAVAHSQHAFEAAIVSHDDDRCDFEALVQRLQPTPPTTSP